MVDSVQTTDREACLQIISGSLNIRALVVFHILLGWEEVVL